MRTKERLIRLESLLKRLYKKNKDELLFHGWHHISFVKNKALVFAKENKANVFIVQSAALVHDLNYITKANSHAGAGKNLREKYLRLSSYSKDEIEWIEKIIIEEETAHRHRNISKEAKALSDADTLFKALPITPILFASKYIQENKVDIAQLAHKVCSEQNKLMKSGIYFYTNKANREYLKWAKANLDLWNNVNDCLKDKDVKNMLEIAKNNKVFN